MGRPSRNAIALSPGGRRLAFVARQGDRQQLYVRRCGALLLTVFESLFHPA